MDEYDVLLYDINREKKMKEEKKFWRGKKWTKEQLKKLEAQDKARLELNHIKSAQEIQREHIREEMGLNDTEGLTLTENNMKKLFFELNNCCILGMVDFSQKKCSMRILPISAVT